MWPLSREENPVYHTGAELRIFIGVQMYFMLFNLTSSEKKCVLKNLYQVGGIEYTARSATGTCMC